MKHYDALTARADRETLELLMALGGNLPITGMLDEDETVSLYFDQGVLNDDIISQLRSSLGEAGNDIEFAEAKIEEQNWNLEFEQSLEPVRVTDNLIFTQSWNPVESANDDLVITIDPKMSFGTGHHESTRLISELLMGVNLKGKSVLDVGTGTGALAIIAAKQGANRILAFDNNEWAVENTHENIALNNTTGQISVLQGEMEEVEETDFDVILANLHRNLITRLLPEFLKKFRNSDSFLLTSGVLIEDYQELLNATERYDLQPLEEKRENEWIATKFAVRQAQDNAL